jgi:large subunit ribosomal protein L5
VGAAEAMTNKNVLQKIADDVMAITGQKPVITKARKSIAAFKLRKGVPIGVKVTLRGDKMYDFLEKIIKIILPRIRDFRGLSGKGFDGQGNLNLGISDQTLFPEIEYDKIDRIRGLEITIVTTTRSDDHSKKLLTKLGLPFEV